MATFCPVAPARILAALKFRNERIVRHNLFLAHDVVADIDSYRRLFGIQTGYLHFSFMDNSLVELKQAVDLQMVMEATVATNSKVFVVPDVYNQGPETVDAVKTHYDNWVMAIKGADPMVVIQGRNFQEWLQCLEDLSQWRKFPWVAVPRVALTWSDSRRTLVNYVKIFQPKAKIHLLGFGDKIYQDLYDSMHPDVSSIDSAVPLRFPSPFLVMHAVAPRGNWWHEAEYSDLMLDNLITAKDLFRRKRDTTQELPY